MENKKDNIDKLVSGMLEQPGLLEQTLRGLVTNMEQSYIAFRDVRDRHTDIGRAAVPAMLRNQSTHVVKNAVEAAATALAHFIEEHPDIDLSDIPGELYRILLNDSQVYDDAVFDAAAVLTPQFVMFDDRYTQEKIEAEILEETPL
jgi:hypothetical protein